MSDENQLKFRHLVIDAHPLGIGNSICLVADVNGDGFKDVIIGNFVTPPEQGYLVWYEYPEWKRHIIARANLEAGGAVTDINGDGRFVYSVVIEVSDRESFDANVVADEMAILVRPL